MALPSFRASLGPGGFVVSAWSSLPDPHVVEVLARASFGAVTFDVQHGLHDLASLREGVGRVVLLGKPALVRVPIEDRAGAARMLDMGAAGVIMPMVEGPEDAARFVAAVKYPPRGRRSFGPTRAADLHGYPSGPAYVEDARGETLAFAMIETRGALERLDAILAIDGLDGVFVGPSDLSIALSAEGTLDPAGAVADAAIRDVAARTASAGKIAAIYALTPDDARRFRGYGYRLACVSSDIGLLRSAAAALVAAASA